MPYLDKTALRSSDISLSRLEKVDSPPGSARALFWCRMLGEHIANLNRNATAHRLFCANELLPHIIDDAAGVHGHCLKVDA
jgi:hypothetical protein